MKLLLHHSLYVLFMFKAPIPKQITDNKTPDVIFMTLISPKMSGCIRMAAKNTCPIDIPTSDNLSFTIDILIKIIIPKINHK